MRIGCVVVFGVLTLCAASIARAQSAAQSSGEPRRGLFPKDWVRGYADFEFAPPHNELDLNRCSPSAGADGGARAPCTAFARYVAMGYLELHPIGATPLRRLFVFWEPHFYFGRNVPLFNYSLSAAPMAYERALGFGVELPKSFEIRLTNHRVSWLGRYQNNLGNADLGKSGPLGLYTTVGVRWSFGGYSHSGTR